MAVESNVLSERKSHDGRVTWQARRSADRGRLEVVAIVQPSGTPTIVPALTDAELRTLLSDAPSTPPDGWRCDACGTANVAGREWCRVCSSTKVAA